MLQSIIGVLFGTSNRIKIQLDRSIYYTGDEITGTVLFEINESIEYTDIVMKLKGSENADLNVNNQNITTMNNNNLTTDGSCYYSLSETFLDQKYTLIGKHSPVSVSGYLNRGHYLLPFRLALPQNLPSSFHFRSYGLHGRIIYGLEVEATVPGLLKKNLKSQVMEVGIRQVSKEPIMPMQLAAELLLQPFWCGGASEIELAVALDKTIYAPGDRISLKFALNTPIKIKYVQVSLVRHVRIGPLERCRREEKLLGRVNTGRISGCIERRACFSIPESEPFSVLGRLIECHYELQFKVRADWCYVACHKHRIVVNDSLLPSYESSQIK